MKILALLEDKIHCQYIYIFPLYLYTLCTKNTYLKNFICIFVCGWIDGGWMDKSLYELGEKHGT